MLAAALLTGLVASACSSESRSAEPGPLTGVCPDPIVIQADWYPEAEHGALFHLIDPHGVDFDGDTESVRGRLTSGGLDQGVDLEIRSGGEAIDHRTISYELHHDPEILLGIVVTDQAIVAHDLHPTTAVMSLLDRDPMMILWDPATFDVETVAELPGDTPVNVFGPALYLDHLVEAGVISADQIDPRHTGTPERFVEAGGSFAQQGHATADPYIYQELTDEWARPIRFQLVHDLGWEVYGGSLVATPATLSSQAECLELLVPLIQQAVVAYADDPDSANSLIAKAVDRFDSGWRYDTDLARIAGEQQRELALVGNGPDATVGNFDIDRVTGLVDRATEVATFEVTATVDDLVTNRFIDPAIGFPE